MRDEPKATYLFVHGSYTGAWIWEGVCNSMRSMGASANAVDLAGYGRNQHVPASLANHAKIVADVLSCSDRPVILVGHSMGGFVVTQAASLVPERVAGLIYVAAFVPHPGETRPDCARRDSASLVPANRRLDQGGAFTTVAEEAVGFIFFDDADTARRRGWTQRFVADPVLSATEACRFDHAVEEIPASYIACTRSKAITIGFQREMQQRRPVQHVIALDSGHMPMLEQPQSLVDALLRCSAESQLA